MKNRMRCALLLVGGLMVACSPYKVVRSEAHKPVETVQQYRSYEFVETDLNALAAMAVTPEQVEALKAAIARQLDAKGYVRGADNPDLLVNIGLTVAEKTQTRETNIREAPRYIGQFRYSWRSQTVPVGTYREGTVSVDVVDARRQDLFWEGAVSSVLTRKTGTDAELDKAMSRLFEKFPGRPESQ